MQVTKNEKTIHALIRKTVEEILDVVPTVIAGHLYEGIHPHEYRAHVLADDIADTITKLYLDLTEET